MKTRNIIISIILILIFLFSILLTSCDEESECQMNSDCYTTKTCRIGKCVNEMCQFDYKDDCCGNNKCETGENKCTCSDDCGACEGKITYNSTTSTGRVKIVEANYARNACVSDKCSVVVDAADKTSLKLSNEMDIRSAFKIEILTTVNNPFDIRSDKANVRITLKDIDTDVGGVNINNIQILSGAEQMGEKIIAKKLNSFGDVFTEELSLTSAQSLIETTKKITIKIGYDYVLQQRDQQVVMRDDSDFSLSEKIVFVNP
ncbi:MAG: hypothetical protein KKF46_03130 [Nanoarchaeota archaeon]|nr:hypothetical protein [Nanoarchaeota archaeon]MBU1321327.1 hypothetical protein [Nanoarchaeota archaeon]MBU1597534.1 hypothetical protein [Nanoarchaeota archaeon]MBU2441125.1 hypothetical protein [Nanoarchaeota archaeon]